MIYPLMEITMFALALLLAGMDDKPYRGEIAERLASPVVATFETSKPSYDLEICIANAVVSLGAPVVLRDGPDNVVVMASMSPISQAFIISASLIKIPTGTRIDMRLRGKGWDERMKERIKACL